MDSEQDKQLLARLIVVRRMSLRDAMGLLGVSESTVRRLFTKLEGEGLAIRTHGGIQYVTPTVTHYNFDQGARSNIEKKEAIAKEACRFVNDGDVIFCDSGTTIQCFCAELAHRLEDSLHDVKVYTNSLANLDILSGVIPVNLIGGTYRPNRRDLCGYISDETLSKLYFNKSFIGADGCFNGTQFSTTDSETAKMNQIAITNCKKTYMLVDSTKFFSASHIIYTSASDLYAIVTDDGIERDSLQKLKKADVRVIVADLKNNGKTAAEDMR